ncbi:MAG: hypothetical protein JO323_02630 [Acidobacteriia bacterium]|nr:hypothetical protein [Terriglobia bacterium]
MNPINASNYNRFLEPISDPNAGGVASVPSPASGTQQNTAAQNAFSEFQKYVLSGNQNTLSSSSQTPSAPSEAYLNNLLLSIWRAICDSLNPSGKTAGDQPIPVGFESGSHPITGMGYNQQANPMYYADNATAQNLAAALGAKVVQASPFGMGPDSVFQAPSANTLQFPGGQTINAGVLANLLNKGYSREYVQSELTQALAENGVTGITPDLSKLYP